MPHRCAFGCAATDVVMHVFPNPEKFPERFRVWVGLVGSGLESLSDHDIYKKKRICDIHFISEHRNRFKRLSALAVPSLHLPNTSTAQQLSAVVNVPATATVPNTASVPEAVAVPDSAPVSDTASVPYAASSDTSTAQQLSAVVNVPATATVPNTASVPEAVAVLDSAPVSDTASVPYAASSDTSTVQQLSAVVDVPATATVPNTASVPEAVAVPDSAPVSDAASVPNAASSGQTSKSVAEGKNLMEHNYSALSKSRPKKAVKDTSGKASFSVHGQPLRKKMRYLVNEINRLRKRGMLYKERLANAEKFSKKVAFQLFMHMQQQTSKKPKGRRFTTEEKILSLSLYKKSPKCYRLLCKYFTLPSNKAMKRLLSQIKLAPGINNIVFEKIKKTVSSKEPSDRLCSLIFDEMSITPQVFYTSTKDQLEGFCTNASMKFADHVLVFMIKGVKNNFKQPIAYYFTNNLNKIELKKMLKIVIEHCFETGLIIVNTVCDQCTVNVGAITDIISETKATFLRQGKEWRDEVMRFKGHNIVPLYDTPHLFKGLRNNLLTKDMTYVSKNEEKTIKWNYFQMVYDADKSYGELRLLDKVTEEHINPAKINKMRVKTATQLLSHSVAVVTEHLTARGSLPAECRQLVDFTLLMDNLFDSLNVSSFSIPNGKIYKGPVKRNSPHHELWQKAKTLLKSVKFIKKVKVGDKIRLVEAIVPSVTNLIKTIEGVETLWKMLSRKYGFDTLLTRNFNQDPLENFFGNVRSYGARNIAPNSVSFEGAYKALLLNNFSTPHSRRSNCEEDFNECLQTFDFFFF